MELLAAACLGLGLSAAGGLRIFLPLLVVGLGQRLGMIELGSSLAWTGGTPALMVLALLCVAEGLGYCIPAVDHALDAVSAPASWVAGALFATGAVALPLHEITTSLPGGIAPVLAYAAGLGGAAAAGAATAGVTQITGASGRVVSSTTTLGVANPVYAMVENLLAGAMSVLAILAPIALGVLGVLAIACVWMVVRRIRRVRTA
ncbi:MAG: DUF4126 domain-containing protein [Phycisphaerales bacterium]|nr:DUF4126 domain-containing protein [Phycisphaerales bacterium]